MLEAGLNIMEEQLDRSVLNVPGDKVNALRKVPLWLNPGYPGIRERAEYHPGAEWLRDNGRDPLMVKSVEFSNLAKLPLENVRMPYVILHELAHAYHDRVLGFDRPDIIAAYKAAKERGNYAKVKRWNGRRYLMDEAYAITNHKEYFAETTEAYFGRNDFYPFNRTELKAHDPQMFDVLKAIWEEE